MAQKEILTVLHKSKGKKFSTEQLQKKMKISRSVIASNISKLKKHNMIKVGYYFDKNKKKVLNRKTMYVWV